MVTSARSALVRRVVSLIEERPADRHSLRTLAQLLNRQEAYLGRLFRQQMGVSVREYIARCRMERAARLIRQREKIEAVALDVGYRSKKNFYRQFREHFGTTPATYRERALAAESERPRDETVLTSLTFRLIGPAIAGGRISDIVGSENGRATFYVAAATGGVWR